MTLNTPGAVWQQFGLDHPLGNDSKGWYDIVTSRVTDDHIELTGGHTQTFHGTEGTQPPQWPRYCLREMPEVPLRASVRDFASEPRQNPGQNGRPGQNPALYARALQMVSVIRVASTYGSALALGRRSSM